MLAALLSGLGGGAAEVLWMSLLKREASGPRFPVAYGAWYFAIHRVFVSGHSAGGHLAAMLALDDKVDGCLAISGIFDLAPISRTSINDDLRLDTAMIARNSPVRLARPGRAPIVIAYGLGETAQFAQQARSFATALARVGRRHRLLAVPHLHHYDIVLELGRPDRGLAMALCGMVGKNA
jgi:acetyl esterase/lipase